VKKDVLRATNASSSYFACRARSFSTLPGSLQDLGEGGDPHALRERTQIREAGRELPVHEHEASRLQDAEQEGFEPLRHDAIGPT